MGLTSSKPNLSPCILEGKTTLSAPTLFNIFSCKSLVALAITLFTFVPSLSLAIRVVVILASMGSLIPTTTVFISKIPDSFIDSSSVQSITLASIEGSNCLKSSIAFSEASAAKTSTPLLISSLQTAVPNLPTPTTAKVRASSSFCGDHCHQSAIINFSKG